MFIFAMISQQLFAREKKREEAKLKKEHDAQEKKRKAAEAAEAKKAARKAAKHTRRKAKRGEGQDESGSEDGAGGDESKTKFARTRGSFDEKDPTILVRGAGLPASYRLGSFSSIKDFLAAIEANKPSLLRNRKASVKKILTKSLKNNSDRNEANQFIVQTSKAFGMTQSNMSSEMKKLSGSQLARKNKTVDQSPEAASLLGMDLLLKAKILSNGDVPDEKKPWLMDRAALVKEVKNFMKLGCM